MKTVLTILLFACFGTSFAQNCLRADLYRQFPDIVVINDSIAVQKELSVLETKPNAMQIIVLPNSYAEFPKWTDCKNNEVATGFKIIVSNAADQAFSFNAANTTLPLQRQVYYIDKWITLNPQPTNTTSRICGNEIQRIRINSIKSGETVMAIAPCFQGSYKAKYRFALYDPINKIQIYSNEFEGYFDTRLLPKEKPGFLKRTI